MGYGQFDVSWRALNLGGAMAVVLHGGRVSVIIPCYNEAQSLREVLRRVEEVQLPVGKEVIVVDDGSADGSPEVAQEFPFVKLLRHKKIWGRGRR